MDLIKNGRDHLLKDNTNKKIDSINKLIAIIIAIIKTQKFNYILSDIY